MDSYHLQKRIIDVIGAVLGLALAFPLFLIIAIAIKSDDHGSVFFRQPRIGLGGRTFTLWKFRSMVEGAERHGRAITVRGDARITRVGKFLRRSKLDELPQLINVLRGEMSLVGPRPEATKYFADWQRIDPRIMNIKPGMTSKASLLYKNEEAILCQFDDPERGYIENVLPQKVALDVDYFNAPSVLRDLAIIFDTVQQLLRAQQRVPNAQHTHLTNDPGALPAAPVMPPVDAPRS